MIDSRLLRNRWGVIYTPRIGALKPMKRWGEIRSYLMSKGVEFDFIESENYESIERLARMFADNGYGTVVVVGGDGALQDAINGIMASERRSEVVLGIIPNGIANNFARYWGLHEDDYKAAVDCIITHRVRKVDVGCCSYDAEEGRVERYFLNVLNAGLSAQIVEIANKKRTLFAKYLYQLFGLLYMLFHRRNFKMKLRLNNQVVDEKFMMLCVGNSVGYGLTPSAVPYNGWLDVSAIRKPKWLGLLEGLLMVAHGKILNFELVMPFRTTEIVIESAGGALFGIDGRPFKPSFPLTVSVKPEMLNLAIPAHVRKK